MGPIELPDVLRPFLAAHAALVRHYADTGLTFTLDGKLLGDVAEATAAISFDLQLCETRTAGVDAHTRCARRRSVQVKATQTQNQGPAFTPGEGIAEHLLFLRFDFNRCVAEVAYNGPEAPVRALLPPKGWTGTKRASLLRVLALDEVVALADRLPLVMVGNAG